MAQSDIEVEPLSDVENARLKELFGSCEKYGQSFVRSKPGNYILPAAYEKCKDRIKNWEFTSNDVCLLTFPKNGTNWMQEILSLINYDWDLEKTKATPISKRGFIMDSQFLFDVLKKEGLPFDFEMLLEAVKAQSSTKLIASHLPFCLLPENMRDKCKVVICFRNPKDTLISKFHFERLVKPIGYIGDFPTYFDLFMNGLDSYGSYFEHVKQAWKNSNHPNVCVMFFEDLKSDMASCLRKLAKFLGKAFTDDQISKAVDFLSFKQMKERGGAKELEAFFNKTDVEGSVMRKGQAGDWKNYFTDEMNKRMDEAIDKHFKPIGLEFKYE